MFKRPVFILGAGATKACGGPLTDEILPAALNGYIENGGRKTPVKDREGLLDIARQFMGGYFNVPRNAKPVQKEDCPSLPMALSMIRRSTEMGRPMGRWEGNNLVRVRRSVEYAVFAVIEAALKLMRPGQQLHHMLLQPLYESDVEPSVISLNYDVIVDNTMFMLSDKRQRMRPPDYRVDIATDRYREFRGHGTFGKLLKIHGSLNWLYCEDCRRLDLFVSEGMRTGKALGELYNSGPFDDAYSRRGTPCRGPGCRGFVSPILITPTYVKDYENPHVEKVWAEAERALAEADRAVIIGYSLPTDDTEVGLMFKRGLDHLPRKHITVIEYVHGDAGKPAPERTRLEGHPTGQRFRNLFGNDLDWHTTGFEGWLDEQRAAGRFPFAGD